MDKNNRTRVLTLARVRKHRIVQTFMRSQESRNVYSHSEGHSSLHCDTTSTTDATSEDIASANDIESPDDRASSSEDEAQNEFNEPNFESATEEFDNRVTLEESTPENLINLEPEIDEIRKWAGACGIRHKHLDGLLSILRRRLLPDLPKSSKTFLGTCGGDYTINKTINAEGSVTEYVYFGIEKGLLACVNPNFHENGVVELQLHIDGLPLFASSYKQLWPILCKVHSRINVYKPFPVAIYAGVKKPSNAADVLMDLVEELNILLENGITIGDTKLTIRLKCFICDTPARAFVKSVKGHTGYGACERCTDPGKKIGSTTVYPSSSSRLRSDTSFRNQVDAKHHVGISPLLQIEPKINLISSFVLDFMHLCCLGIMKKLLGYWLDPAFETCLRPADRARLDERLQGLWSQIPVEFQRKLRSLSLIAKWKATEYRVFLLYVGPVVLKNILPTKMYKHFMLFSVACRFLCDRSNALRYNRYAKYYLTKFFKLARSLYGPKSQIMNMHNLIHLADDAKNMGCELNLFTAFPFESFLGQLKRLLRSGNAPLAQICRRLHEMSLIVHPRPVLPPEIEIIKQGPADVRGYSIIQKLKYRDQTLTIKAPQNIVILQDKKILRIKSMYIERSIPDNIYVEGEIWKTKQSLSMYPFDTKHLQMWQLELEPSAMTVTHTVNYIDRKALLLRLDGETANKSVFLMPLLHG